MAVCTVHVRVPYGVTEKEIVEILKQKAGDVRSWNFSNSRKKSRGEVTGWGNLQFKLREDAERACHLSASNSLILRGTNLVVTFAKKDLSRSPTHEVVRWTKSRFWGGCLVSPTRFKQLWAPEVETVTELDFGAKLLRLLFKIDNAWEYQMEFPMKDSLKIIPLMGEHKQSRSFVLQPGFAPRVHMRRVRVAVVNTGFGDLDAYIKLGQTSSKDICNIEDVEDPWIRTGDFLPHRPIAQCQQYVLTVNEVPEEVYEDAMKNLRGCNVVAAAPNEQTFASENERPLSLVIEHHDYYAAPGLLAPVLNSPYHDSLDYDVLYKLNGLVQSGKLPGPSITPGFLEKLNSSWSYPAAWTLDALQEMQMQESVVYDPEDVFERFHKRRRTEAGGSVGVESKMREETSHVKIRRLMVTPTKVYFIGPDLEMSNRVTRQYSKYIDNFLRVTFVEEDMNELQSAALAKAIRGVIPGKMRPEATPVHDRMKEIMAGFWIRDKRFEFLAFSASQLREKSLWMFASPSCDITAHSIRAWMGNFDAIRNVPKFAARMGQCFSASTATVTVPSYEVEHISDIEVFCNGIKYNFSDGIGVMSVAFATDVANRVVKQGAVPSAFQIRFGGYKGVVAQDPGCRTAKLRLRASMCKFDSPHSEFEVLSFSKPQACYLNRQIIILLSTLGIEDAVFEGMQDEMLQQLDRMLDDKDVALKVLEVHHPGDTYAASVAMLKMNFNPAEDPYLRGMLHVFRAKEVANLQSKSRILVPKGRMLLGCLDERRILGEDEVFVQVSALGEGRLDDDPKLTAAYEGGLVTSYVVTGLVMVTRNPCLHPGDIRVCRAVNVPQLKHFKDCVVFSQVGVRPVPSMCSGGDLDGDMFTVVWDPRLIPSKTEPPMDYAAPPEKKLDCAPSIMDIIEFHADSAMNQTLGPISNAHLVQADRSPMLARDPKCLELARLASLAVDFPKTGHPAILHSSLRPTEYPDFMEKDRNVKVYESSSILGKLYRKVEHPEFLPGFQSPTREALQLCFDQAMIVEGYEDCLQDAESHKDWYDKKLMGLMNQYGIERECEIISGRVLKLSSAYRRRGGDEQERIDAVMKDLKKQASTYVYGDVSGDRSEKKIDARVSACYYVTYHPDYFCRNSARASNVHLLSFAWHFWDRLVMIKNSRGACIRSVSFRPPGSSDRLSNLM